MTSCLSSFFPVYNELTASRQTVKHFIFQCYMSAKGHQFINSFMIYNKPANVTFSVDRQTEKSPLSAKVEYRSKYIHNYWRIKLR